MGNHLRGQSSPYLLQHAENPVEWYPWCQEAFDRARQEDKPIFLSIGYSTCHWCHVMAHESFENTEVADILNRYFISIKVDREERPDIDSVYMAFCQAFTGSGGWPMSIFMTAEQKPFFAGTYFPPESRLGMIGFKELLLTVAARWQDNRSGLLKTASDIVDSVSRSQDMAEEGKEVDNSLPKLATKHFLQSFDRANGGFGQAPKFPTPHNLLFLLLYAHIYKKETYRELVEITLERMRRGGIFDQIGYGFSRYSTDPYFLVPHFEKMLYDNALLILAYSGAYKASGQPVFLDTAQKTADYIFREMTGPEGAFYSAQDADSQGQEGKFYLWDYEEILDVLGENEGKKFCEHYNITKTGNFEGRNIPNQLNGSKITTFNGNSISEEFREEKKILYNYRKSRAKLHLDDKILTSWNSLMICAMAMLYRVSGKRCYLEAAQRAQNYIEKYLADGRGLLVGCRNGKGEVKGFLDEYAYYTWALLSLYEVTSEEWYLARAEQICRGAKEQFADEGTGGYFLYGRNNAALITRPKETYDGALPSGNSVMAYCLVRLLQLTGEEAYRQESQKQLAFLSGNAKAIPEGHCMFLIALLLYQNPPQKITVILSPEDSREAVLSQLPLYADVQILSGKSEGYSLLDGKTTYYVCKENRCLPPTTELCEVTELYKK